MDFLKKFLNLKYIILFKFIKIIFLFSCVDVAADVVQMKKRSAMWRRIDTPRGVAVCIYVCACACARVKREIIILLG